ncbi:MAG: FkbM family methyltransferase [Chitinophagales bacterium]
MNLLSRVKIKLRSEKRFFLEQKWGWVKGGGEDIPKYLLKKYLPSNPVIIDCGAHVGSDAVDLARIFPAANIHCFEPVTEIFQSLQHNTRKYRQIHCHKIALSGEDGKSAMFVSSGHSDGSSSINKPKDHLIDHPGVYFDKKEEVETNSLDNWAVRNKISVVDFLWLDMQGHEFSMLSASSSILPTVKLIHSEVSIKEVYEDSKLYPDYKSWLESKGFGVLIEAIPPGADMGNVLFLRKK